MEQIEHPEELRKRIGGRRCAGASIGLVPTMGYLHVGHQALLRVARSENDVVVLSIYVNPSQFGPGEDFDRYPRDLDRDRGLAEASGADVLFTPSDSTMFPGGTEGQMVWVDPGEVGRHLEGASRPVHFRGVATVVAKLFNLVRPDRAYFGQKDAQQAAVVSRLAIDLSTGVEVRIVPTVREPDGLALSSRNVYLSTEERTQAASLKLALDQAATLFHSGIRDPRHLQRRVVEVLADKAPRARLDYATVADLARMEPIEGDITEPALLALAVYFGSTRLIDNVVLVNPG